MFAFLLWPLAVVELGPRAVAHLYTRLTGRTRHEQRGP